MSTKATVINLIGHPVFDYFSLLCPAEQASSVSLAALAGQWSLRSPDPCQQMPLEISQLNK